MDLNQRPHPFGLIPLSGLFAKVTLYPEGSVMDMEQELLNDVIREYKTLFSDEFP